MDLNLLRTFLAVARHRNLTRAAAELHLSQPAVSRQIAALEAAVGAPLLVRPGRQVELTAAGRVLLEHAERLLDLAERARRAVAELAGLAGGTLTVAASTAPAGHLLGPLLAAFRRRFPAVRVRLLVRPSAEVEQLVLGGQADVGVAATPLTARGLQALPCCGDELVLAVPPGHPLAGRADVGREELAAVLARDCLLVREPASATRRAGDAHLAALGVEPGAVLEAGHPEAITAAVAAGAGVSFLSRLALAPALAAGRVAVAAGPAARVPRQIHFLTAKGASPGPAALAFLALARKEERGGGEAPWRTSASRSA